MSKNICPKCGSPEIQTIQEIRLSALNWHKKEFKTMAEIELDKRILKKISNKSINDDIKLHQELLSNNNGLNYDTRRNLASELFGLYCLRYNKNKYSKRNVR